MKDFLSLLLRVLIGTIIGTCALVALLFSFIPFSVCLAAGVCVGALVAARSRQAYRKHLVIDSIAYAAFFLVFAFVLGPGHAAPLPFFLFYMICSAVLFTGYVLGGVLKQRTGGPLRFSFVAHSRCLCPTVRGVCLGSIHG